MTVTVHARHSKKCPKSKEKNAGQYKRCGCPLWLRWGKDGNRSAHTRSWDIATKAARKLEQDLELEALGIEPIKKPDHITIESAADLYLWPTWFSGKSKTPRRHDECSPAWGLRQRRRVILLKDVTARLLTEWRSTWKFNRRAGAQPFTGQWLRRSSSGHFAQTSLRLTPVQS